MASVPSSVGCCAKETQCPSREICIAGVWTDAPARIAHAAAATRTAIEARIESAVDVGVSVVVNVECGNAAQSMEVLPLSARETRVVVVPVSVTRESICVVSIAWDGRQIGRQTVNLPNEDAGIDDGGLFIHLTAIGTFDAGIIVTNQQHPARRYVVLRNEDPSRTSPAMQLPLATDCQNLTATLDLPEIGPGDAGIARMNITVRGLTSPWCQMWATAGETDVAFSLLHDSSPLPPVLLAFSSVASCSDGSLVIQNAGPAYAYPLFLDTPLVVPEDAGIRMLDDWLVRQLPPEQSLTIPFECDPGAPAAYLEINANFPRLRIEIRP